MLIILSSYYNGHTFPMIPSTITSATLILILIMISLYPVSSQIQQKELDKPSSRWANECVLLTFNGTLVCYGGQLENGLATNTMYSLNLYQSWNTTEPAWSIMETAKYDRNDVTRPVAFFAATYLPNAHHFLIDGGTISSENKSSSNNETLYYDPINETWLQPNIRGQRAVRRKQHTGVSDDQDRIWLWGGLSDISTYAGTNVYYNTWTIINTKNWIISNPIVENNPSPRIDHTATMISNKYILIIGGVVYSHDVTDPTGQLTLNPVSMSSLLLFDITKSQWINITAGGNIPAPRRGHSAVLSFNEKHVIIFGGGMPEDERTQLNDVFILELATMSWTAPSIKGVPPKPRRYHKACIVDDNMLVMFGFGGKSMGYNDVNILSTSTWSWITQYTANIDWLSGNTSSTNGIISNNTDNGTIPDPHTATNEPNDHDLSSQSRITAAGVIAGVISGSVVILGGGIFLVLSVLIFKRKQNKHKESSNSNIVDPASILQDSESTISGFTTEVIAHVYAQKPDNRSSICYAPQVDDGKYYKPNAKTED